MPWLKEESNEVNIYWNDKYGKYNVNFKKWQLSREKEKEDDAKGKFIFS